MYLRLFCYGFATTFRLINEIGSTLAGISIVVREVQPAKPSSVLSCVPFSKVTVFREEQPKKASSSIVSTLAGISIEVNASQPSKAYSSIVSTLAGIEIETNKVFERAYDLIAVSVLGRMRLLILVHPENTCSGKTERFTLEISRCSKLGVVRIVIKSNMFLSLIHISEPTRPY